MSSAAPELRTERWGRQLRAWAPGGIHRARVDYAVLRDRHTSDPRDAEDAGGNAASLATNNPLMPSKDSPWAVYFRNQEVGHA